MRLPIPVLRRRGYAMRPPIKIYPLQRRIHGKPSTPNEALTIRLSLNAEPTAFLCRNKTTATQNRNHIITFFYLKTPPTDFGINTKKTPAKRMAGAYILHNGSYSAFASPGSCPAVLSSATLNSVKPAPTRILNHDSAFFISDTCTRSRS